ncbi:hypothetical protein [Microbacterium invictum]|uniref:Uncharacterized protein n=1 Tax=Microbacterium invictum TaxID=515415 RepID=A0ABZ0VGM6_9MICO|nr:hypothetical protein [Microbacterium invictum]WQB71340.1 hypothetical protein T9R20_05065 [Microbacterium invictum]
MPTPTPSPLLVSDASEAAVIGLWGVILGAALSLVGTVLIPWLRDSLDRRREARESLERERRDSLLATISALLDMRQAQPGDRGDAQARFGTNLNNLTVRLTPEEQPILDVLMLMLAMVQEPRRNINNMVGESMAVLTLWVRGDIQTNDVISEVEMRAGVTFAPDRKSASVTKPAPAN